MKRINTTSRLKPINYGQTIWGLVLCIYFLLPTILFANEIHAVSYSEFDSATGQYKKVVRKFATNEEAKMAVVKYQWDKNIGFIRITQMQANEGDFFYTTKSISDLYKKDAENRITWINTQPTNGRASITYAQVTGMNPKAGITTLDQRVDMGNSSPKIIAEKVEELSGRRTIGNIRVVFQDGVGKDQNGKPVYATRITPALKGEAQATDLALQYYRLARKGVINVAEELKDLLNGQTSTKSPLTQNENDLFHRTIRISELYQSKAGKISGADKYPTNGLSSITYTQVIGMDKETGITTVERNLDMGSSSPEEIAKKVQELSDKKTIGDIRIIFQSEIGTDASGKPLYARNITPALKGRAQVTDLALEYYRLKELARKNAATIAESLRDFIKGFSPKRGAFAFGLGALAILQNPGQIFAADSLKPNVISSNEFRNKVYLMKESADFGIPPKEEAHQKISVAE